MIEKIQPYIPSAEEMKLAEDSMNNEERNLSEIREKNWEQINPWDDLGENFKDMTERRKIKPEEAEKINLSLKQLGKIFNESGVNWHLDGALNISLMKGEFIGMHKDIDISIERNNLEKLEAFLNKKEYAFFHSYYSQETDKNIMRRVGHSDVGKSMHGNYLIASINKEGKLIKRDNLSTIDLHITERNTKGLPINKLGIELPEKWHNPQQTIIMSETINLSHPALIAYHKLQFWREYDMKDLYILAELNKLTLEDVNEIRDVIEKNLSVAEQMGEKIMSEIADQIKKDSTLDEIFNKLSSHPALKDFSKNKKEALLNFAQKIFESEDKSNDSILKLAYVYFEVDKRRQQIMEKLNNFKQKIIECSRVKK